MRRDFFFGIRDILGIFRNQMIRPCRIFDNRAAQNIIRKLKVASQFIKPPRVLVRIPTVAQGKADQACNVFWKNGNLVNGNIIFVNSSGPPLGSEPNVHRVAWLLGFNLNENSGTGGRIPAIPRSSTFDTPTVCPAVDCNEAGFLLWNSHEECLHQRRPP